LSVGTLSGLNFVANGGKARSRGFEAAVQYAPGLGWQINGNLALTDAKLVDSLPPNPLGPPNPSSLGRKGDRLPDQARVAGNVGIEKSWDLPADFRMNVGGNFSYIGERDQLFRSTAAPVARQGKVAAPSYHQIDLYAGLTKGKWSANLYVRNLGSERGILNISDGQGSSTNTFASFILPQTIGFVLAGNF
jgi:outer membrane receptor protein involved in Fe transport